MSAFSRGGPFERGRRVLDTGSVPEDQPTELPPYRAVLVVDTKEFGGNTDGGQELLATAIADVLALAFDRSGLGHVLRDALFPHNTGDGYGIGFDTRHLPAVVTRLFDTLQDVLAQSDPDQTFLSVALSQRVFDDVLTSGYASLPPSPARRTARPSGLTLIARHPRRATAMVGRAPQGRRRPTGRGRPGRR